MNVFVLCTGRCGSVTFTQACRHITNYSAGHETRNKMIGPEHFKYPVNHIEADNRLSWFLGSLDRAYGDGAFYVHLRRNDIDTARSFLNRWRYGIMNAYHSAIATVPEDVDRLAVCVDYCRTVNDNIESFLKDKAKKASVMLENVEEDFPVFWSRIGARGSIAAAMAEWGTPYNRTEPVPEPKGNRYLRKASRIVWKFPAFLRQA